MVTETDLPLSLAAMRERGLDVARVTTCDFQRPPRSAVVYWRKHEPHAAEFRLAEHLLGVPCHHDYRAAP